VTEEIIEPMSEIEEVGIIETAREETTEMAVGSMRIMKETLEVIGGRESHHQLILKAWF
jgi:hypothetical protein